jgi:pyruvate dehydrogenase E1 component beta subunit
VSSAVDASAIVESAGATADTGAVGTVAAGTSTMTLAGAINRALADAMAANDKMIVMGEDVGQLGGVFRVTDGLAERFGSERVRDTPLAEAGIVGTAVGLALRGYVPVCEIQFDGFVFPAFSQIVTQVAKLHARSGGRITMGVVLRLPYGGGIGAIEHHSESPEALLAHIAGLRVVSPSTPADAYAMTRAAVEHPDPVVMLEPKARYWDKGEVAPTTGADLGVLAGARVARPGRDVTLLAYGPSMRPALAAAQEAAQDGIEAEVLDLRSLSPVDFDAIEQSVRRTTRAVVVHEAPVFLGLGAEIAARITERCFYLLQAPVLRVGGYHMPYPPALVEADYLPSPERILAAIHATLAA